AAPPAFRHRGPTGARPADGGSRGAGARDGARLTHWSARFPLAGPGMASLIVDSASAPDVHLRPQGAVVVFLPARHRPSESDNLPVSNRDELHLRPAPGQGEGEGDDKQEAAPGRGNIVRPAAGSVERDHV